MSIQQPLVLPVSLVKTEPSTLIKNEPPESEIVEIGIDGILDSSESKEEISPDTKFIDVVYHPLYEGSIISETVLENILESKHSKSVEAQVLVKTEKSPFIKTENIIQRNKIEITSDGNVSRGIDQEMVEIQGSNEHFNALGNLETEKQLVLNLSNDLNDFTTRNSKTVETISLKKDKEKIKVIKAPVIPIEPHEYTSLARDKHVCNYCQHSSKTLKLLKTHIKLMHRKVTTMYQCPYCLFKSKWNIRKHIISHHKDTKDIQWFQCHLCEKKFKSKSEMTRHTKVHLTLDQMKDRLELCPICGKGFKAESSMRRHMRLVHNKMKRKGQKCEYTTESQHKQQRYLCEKCAFATEFHTNFILHKLSHKTKTEIDDQDLKYRCDKCDYKTYKPYALKEHKLKHLKPEEIQYFHCYHCSYKCPRKSQLKNHIFRHHGEIKHHSKCDETKHKYQLESHTKNHEKRYHCDKCNYQTYRNDALKRHKLIHLEPEEIQYFYCYHCSYKFTQKENLKSHILRHLINGEIGFDCYICNFMTRKRESIIEHIKNHSKVHINSVINEGS